MATESFVYRVVNNAEERLEKRVGKLEGKMDKRFDKAMVHLEERVVMSGRLSDHGDRIEKLEDTVYKFS